MGQLCCCCKKKKHEQNEKFLATNVQQHENEKHSGDYKSPSYEMIAKMKSKAKSKRNNHLNNGETTEPACWFNDYRQSRRDKNEFIQNDSPIDIVYDAASKDHSSSNTSNLLLNLVSGRQHSSQQSGSSFYDAIENIDNFNISIKYLGIEANKCGLINNGQTVEGVCGQSNNFIILSNKMNENEKYYYRLKSFHFHTPCEHLINHNMYDMELHLIHECPNTFDIAVIVVLFETGISRNELWPEYSTTTNNTNNNNNEMDSSKSGRNNNNNHNNSNNNHLGTHSRTHTVTKSISTQFALFNNQSFTDNEFLSQFWDQMPRFQNVKYPSSVRNEIKFEKLLLFAQNEFNMNDIPKSSKNSKEKINKNDIFRKWNNMLENTESRDLFEDMYGDLPLSVKYCILLMNEDNIINHSLFVDFFYYSEYCENPNCNNNNNNNNHSNDNGYDSGYMSNTNNMKNGYIQEDSSMNSDREYSANNNNENVQNGEEIVKATITTTKQKIINRNVNVRWFISKKVQKMSYKQFRKLRDIQSYLNNARQCKNSHNVSYQVLTSQNKNPENSRDNRDSKVSTVPSTVSFVDI